MSINTLPSNLRRPVGRRQGSILAAALQVASAFLADTAHAQSSACDQLKSTLAARIDPGIRGFSLDTVPAGTPVPPGAKVIGTCEGGARKILLRRGGGTSPSSASASAIEPDAAPQAVATTAEPARRTPEIQAARAPASSPAPRPVPRPLEAAPAVVPAPARVHEKASDAAPVRAVDVSPQAPAPAPPDPLPAATPADAPPASGLLARFWPWLLALLLLPVAGWLRAWVAYRRAYDEAGLPRGPRLN